MVTRHEPDAYFRDYVRTDPQPIGYAQSPSMAARVGALQGRSTEVGAIDFTPMNDYLVVRPDIVEKRTAGGILLPDDAQATPTQGRVVAVGPGMYAAHGVFVPTSLRPGDWIRFGKWVVENGQHFEHEGEKLLLMKENDVLGKIPSKCE